MSSPVIDIHSNKRDSSIYDAALRALRGGGIVAFPTDTLYGIGCAFDKPRAAERIHRLRDIDPGLRPLTYLLPDVGELARWAQVSGSALRVLDRIFPGPYCVELRAAGRGRRRPGQRDTIGVRIPDDAFCTRLLWLLGVPVLTATAKDRQGSVLHTAEEIRAAFGDELDLIIDGGRLDGPPSTVVSLVDDWVDVLRPGRGPIRNVLSD